MTDATDATTPVTDWRGTPITPGALVIYGGPVGRSIQMVEATVADPMLTPSGRIWLNVVRRSYSHGDKPEGERVHVGADRLTIVEALPATGVPTDAQRAYRRRVKQAAREAFSEGLHEREGHPGEPSRYIRYGEKSWEERWVPCPGCVDSMTAWEAAYAATDLADG